MSDLERFRDTPVPRPEDMCRRGAARIEPMIGAVMYGILWVFGPVNVALVAGLLGLVGLERLGMPDTVFDIVVWPVALGLPALAMWPFVRWVRNKRRRARELIRDGEIVEARLSELAVDRIAQVAARAAFGVAGHGLAVRWYRVVFEHGGKSHHALAPFARRPSEDACPHMLFHPACKYGIAFDEAGNAYVCRVRAD